MSKRILIVLGHPASGSYCAALADSYWQGAHGAGHEVQIIRLGELRFDPVMRGYGQAQSLEPDLLAAQQAILWAEHLVFVYPVWWGSMPALLKGFFDRVFLPSFAFKYRQGSVLWDKLLAGRSAQILVTMDSPPWYYRWVNRMPGHRQVKNAILEFSGIKPVWVHDFGPVRGSSERQRQVWLERAWMYGFRA